MSERHTRRMLAAYREQGAAALAPGNRGRHPYHALRSADPARSTDDQMVMTPGLQWVSLMLLTRIG